MAFYCEKHADDEKFVGNTKRDSRDNEKMRQYGINFRLGDVAYDIEGNKIKNPFICPLFVKKESLKKYDDYMMEQMREARKNTPVSFGNI